MQKGSSLSQTAGKFSRFDDSDEVLNPMHSLPVLSQTPESSSRAIVPYNIGSDFEPSSTTNNRKDKVSI
jgi:hypothetical protein